MKRIGTKAHANARRRLMKAIAVAGGAVGAGRLIPQTWQHPVVASVMLPAHAISTNDNCADFSITAPYDLDLNESSGSLNGNGNFTGTISLGGDFAASQSTNFGPGCSPDNGLATLVSSITGSADGPFSITQLIYCGTVVVGSCSGTGTAPAGDVGLYLAGSITCNFCTNLFSIEGPGP